MRRSAYVRHTLELPSRGRSTPPSRPRPASGLFGIDVRDRLTVTGCLLPVLRGLAAVGLGLEPIQGCLFTLLRRGVTTSGGSIAGLDQIRAVTGARVTVLATPNPIDPSPPTVERGVLDQDDR
jgi:hypothetical protein